METALLVAILLITVLLFQNFRKPQGALGEFSATLQTLTQTVQLGQTQIATLTEKISRLEPVLKQSIMFSWN